MSDAHVPDEMVARFLAWKLPQDFSPDCHIRFDRDAADAGSWPVGTNLLNAIQARAMLKHVLDVAPGPLDFGDAIRALKAGKRVARVGWNGRGMWVEYAPAKDFSFSELAPHFVIKNVNNSFSTWLPSINDCLAEDWQIVS